MSEMREWQPEDLPRLVEAIREFETKLPGWWWSVGACSVSRDASCGPDRHGPDAHLLGSRNAFEEGFHCDDRDGSLADALLDVMEQALTAKAALNPASSAAKGMEG